MKALPTQGANLAMSLFAMGTLPILRWLERHGLERHGLERHERVPQVWLADDVTGVGDLCSLLEWWRDIIAEAI